MIISTSSVGSARRITPPDQDAILDGTLLHHHSYFDDRRGYVRSEPLIRVLNEVAA